MKKKIIILIMLILVLVGIGVFIYINSFNKSEEDPYITILNNTGDAIENISFYLLDEEGKKTDFYVIDEDEIENEVYRDSTMINGVEADEEVGFSAVINGETLEYHDSLTSEEVRNGAIFEIVLEDGELEYYDHTDDTVEGDEETEEISDTEDEVEEEVIDTEEVENE